MGLESVELVMAFEEEFGISIPDSAAAKMTTPADVIDFVHVAVSLVPREVVAAKVKQIVLEQLGLPESTYSETKRFIEDFGVD
jgi:acyl carrier protein